jgi:hypothetical protein
MIVGPSPCPAKEGAESSRHDSSREAMRRRLAEDLATLVVRHYRRQLSGPARHNATVDKTPKH